MEQRVRVKETYPDGTAQVFCIRESACSGDCHHCSGCGAQKETVVLTADNPIGAEAGDLVTIRTESGPVLKAAAMLYMMPLVLFFAGYAVGAALGGSGGLWGGAAFLISIVLIVGYDRRMTKNGGTAYTITGYAADPLQQSKKRR